MPLNTLKWTAAAALFAFGGLAGASLAAETPTAAQIEDENLRALAEVIKRHAEAQAAGQDAGQGAGQFAVSGDPAQPRPPVFGHAGNLHESGILLPSNATELLTYIGTFEERVTRLEGALTQLCLSMSAEAPQNAVVLDICSTLALAELE